MQIFSFFMASIQERKNHKLISFFMVQMCTHTHTQNVQMWCCVHCMVLQALSRSHCFNQYLLDTFQTYIFAYGMPKRTLPLPTSLWRSHLCHVVVIVVAVSLPIRNFFHAALALVPFWTASPLFTRTFFLCGCFLSNPFSCLR